MANGNFGGGAGTIEDPYLVEDVYDFRGCVTAGCFYKLVNDIDMNDTEFCEGWTQMSVLGTVDGDGRTIRNMIIQGGVTAIKLKTTSVTVIKNLNFENIIIRDTSILFQAYSDYPMYLENCRLSVYMDNGGCGVSRYAPMKYCSVTITGRCPTLEQYGLFDLISTAWHEYCSFYFDNLSFKGIATDYTLCLIARWGDIKDCSVRGNIYYDNYPELRIASFKNSYAALAIDTGGSAVSCQISAYSTDWIAFYDSDIIGENITVSAVNGALALTTEQCKSAEYLNSIGFLCGEG